MPRKTDIEDTVEIPEKPVKRLWGLVRRLYGFLADLVTLIVGGGVALTIVAAALARFTEKGREFIASSWAACHEWVENLSPVWVFCSGVLFGVFLASIFRRWRGSTAKAASVPTENGEADDSPVLAPEERTVGGTDERTGEADDADSSTGGNRIRIRWKDNNADDLLGVRIVNTEDDEIKGVLLLAKNLERWNEDNEKFQRHGEENKKIACLVAPRGIDVQPDKLSGQESLTDLVKPYPKSPGRFMIIDRGGDKYEHILGGKPHEVLATWRVTLECLIDGERDSSGPFCFKWDPGRAKAEEPPKLFVVKCPDPAQAGGSRPR